MGKWNNGYNTPCGVYPRRLMTIYYDMKQRCYYNKHRMFHLYGGRGIKICSEWLGDYGAKNFYDWALKNGYDKEMTLDRIDNRRIFKELSAAKQYRDVLFGKVMYGNTYQQ